MIDITARGLASKNAASLAEIAYLAPKPSGTDDTTAIQNVINSLTNGATLIFSAGTYNYTNLSFNQNNIKVVSQGKVTLKCSAVTSSAISVLGTNVTFDGIVFDFNNMASVGLDIQPTQNITLNKCEVRNAFNNAKDEVTALIKFQGNTSGITIRDCIVDTANNNSTGPNAAGVSRGIWMFVYNSQTCTKNVLISNCQINNITPHTDADGIQLSGILNDTSNNNITVEKCIFTNCAKRGIKIMASGVFVQNNTISNQWAGVLSDWSDGMHSAIAIYSSNVTVANNRIYGNSFQQVFDLSPDPSYWMKNVNILDNFISPMEGAGTVNVYQGVIQVCTTIDGLIINKNIIKNGKYGIYFKGAATNVSISQNNINVTDKGVYMDSTVIAGITTNFDFFTIDQNIIKATSFYGIHIITGGNNIKLIGNIITSGLEGISSGISTLIKIGNIGSSSSGVFMGWATTAPSANATTWGQTQMKYTSGSPDVLLSVLRNANNSYTTKQIAVFSESLTSAAIGNGATISTLGFSSSRVAPAAAVTGAILQAGTYAGQEVIILNESTSANSVTFAASGSNVSGGSSVVINGGQASRFVWDSGTSLWYKIS